MSDDFKKLPEGVARWPDDNEPVVVLRPINRGMTLSLAKIAVEHQNEDALKEAVSGGPARFLGFLVQREDGMMAVDENGENPVPVEAGDIFAGPSNLRKPD